MANTEAIWNETTKNYEHLSADERYMTRIHISNNLTILQVGANEKEEMRLSFGDMSAQSLGVRDVFFSPPERAAEATTKIDAAIARVSSVRARLGAYQNRLEHTVSNLTTASSNLSASESRIRDLDMAKEMMRFTRLNILMQAGTSMLAQANQLPENVLGLLK
jgi:flagellin